MGSTRQDNTQQQQEAPTFSGGEDVAMQNDLFGDMMKAQAENRQKQLAMRMNRLGQMGYGGSLLGAMPQQQMPWQGLLQALAQMQAQQQAQQQAPQQQPDSVWNSPFTSQGGTG